MFVRNGSDYPGPEARGHLEKKLNYLQGKRLINSAEDFIERAASKNSISGSAYTVKCPAGEQLASTWLTTELQRQRQPQCRWLLVASWATGVAADVTYQNVPRRVSIWLRGSPYQFCRLEGPTVE
jgi:hypothetical protein